MPGEPSELQDSIKFLDDVLGVWKTREVSLREELLEDIRNDIVSPRNLLMAHFHYPDIHQHFYGDESIGRFNESKLRKVYAEMDGLAGDIREAEEKAGYKRIVFMSDHGLPTEVGHNENAF